MRKTSITVHGEQWDVPFGFGREYTRALKSEARLLAKGSPGQVIELIRNQRELIGYTASIESISNWPHRKRIEASVYASNIHLRASDNIMRAHPKPEWLPEPWAGGRHRTNLLYMNSPTVLE